jgi:hypothetical protein
MESLGAYLLAGAFCLMALRSRGGRRLLSVTMTIYWITFHIEEEIVGGKNWNDRYNALIAAIDQNSSRWWYETTSFIVFDSISSIDGLAYKFKATIAPSKDLFLLRVMDSRSARVCGRITDQTIFMVMPYLEVI